MRNILYILAVLFFSASELLSQSLTIFEQNSTAPVADAIIIQAGKLIGNTNEQGYCKLKGMDIKSKVCIKTFGFIDTCLYLLSDQQEIYLQPYSFETAEVTITAKSLSVKEQFLKYYLHSTTLANKEEQWQSFRFKIEVSPYSLEGFDRIEGVFSFEYPSANSRMRYKDLYECYVKHTLSKTLMVENDIQDLMDKSSLPITIMNLYHVSTSWYKAYKKRMKASQLYRVITDSSSIFTYIDSTNYPSKQIWSFDKDGRIRSYECLRKMEESKSSFSRSRGNKHTYIVYSKSGLLKPESIDVLLDVTNDSILSYKSRTTMQLDTIDCSAKDKRIPVGCSNSSWAKLNDIPTTIIED